MSIINSNKRKNNENINSEKKLKIDKENNNNCEIDILKLKNQKISKLKSIADSMGILIKSGIKKNDIIEKINIVNSRKKELLKQVEVESNLNSFNKDIVEFKIKDGIDNLEWLFWKIFRNKFIYKKIMSFMDTVISPSYESLISVDKMISLKQFEILRDKVLNNKYLVFSNQLLSIIYSSFKNDNDQDRLFYKQLFKYYGQYSLDFNNIGVIYSENGKSKKVVKKENGRNDLVIHLIELDCIPAVQVLIEEYQYKPTINDLKYSINIGKLKFIKLFLQPKFNLNFDFNNNKSYDIKVLNYFFNQRIITKNVIKNNLFNDGNQFYYNNGCYHPMTLNSLIKSCKFIIKSKSDRINRNLINNLSEIELFTTNLTRDDLKLELINEKNQIKSKKETIIKLLDFYYQFMKIEKFQFHYVYFNEKDHWEDDYEIGIDIKPDFFTFISSFHFGNYKIIKKSFDESFIDPFLKQFYKIKIFSHCNNINQEQKLKFVQYLLESYTLFRLDNQTIFNLLVFYNDLELIKNVTLNLNYLLDPFKNLFYFNPFKISEFVQSKEILEWIIENNFELFFKDTSLFWYFKNVEILKNCESIYKIKFNGKLIELTNFEFNINSNVQTLNYILKSGPSVFKINDNYFDIYHIIFNVHGNSNEKLELCKLAYTNFNLSPFSFLLYFDSFYQKLNEIDSNCIYKFIDWLYRYYKNEFELFQFDQKVNLNSNIYQFLKQNQKGLINSILFKIGRFNDIETNLGIGFQYLYHMDSECIEQFDFLLKIYSNSLFDLKDEIYCSLEDIIKSGRLKSIIHIHQKHNWLFKKISPSNPKGLFTFRELNRLLAFSFRTYNLQITEFLFEIFTITKKEFKKAVSTNDISFVYFKNKLK